LAANLPSSRRDEVFFEITRNLPLFHQTGGKLKFHIVDFAAAKIDNCSKNKNARFRPVERADVFVSNVAFTSTFRPSGLFSQRRPSRLHGLFVRFGIVSNPLAEFLVPGNIADFSTEADSCAPLAALEQPESRASTTHECFHHARLRNCGVHCQSIAR
jgi:hypothetical protein